MTNEVENLHNAKLKHKSGKIEEAIKIYQKLIIKKRIIQKFFSFRDSVFTKRKLYKNSLLFE